MAAIVAASNFLVQFPVAFRLGGIDLGQILTWGAFTYPVAFLVTDMTNRRFGPVVARRVVAVGFAVAVLWSILVASPRIALASGLAFLVGQLLDVVIFDRLRADRRWWRAPLLSSLLGSVLDTLIFFGLAFAPAFFWLDTAFGRADASLGFAAPFWGIGAETAFWHSLAAGDFAVKLAVALLLLAPYRVLRSLIADGVLSAQRA